MLLGFISEIKAQEPNFETVFTKRANKINRTVKGYGGFYGDFTMLNKNKSTFIFYSIGFSAGITYKKKQSFGVFSESLLYFPGSFRPNITVDPDKIIGSGLLGITYTLRPKPEKSTHLAYNLKIGDIAFSEFSIKDDSDDIEDVFLASGWVLNPNIVLESNLTPWLRLNVEGGYRFTNGTIINDINVRKDLSGPSLKIGLIFGKIR